MANKAEAQRAIENMRNFGAGSWTGFNVNDDRYEVRSFGVLIAQWVRNDGWTVTTTKYTVTTSKHTRYTAEAIQAERDGLIPREQQEGPTFKEAAL